MDYWQGWMNWPLHKEWACEVCDDKNASLEWGILHGQCRCNACHTEYTMRDPKGEVVMKPICIIKPLYLEAFKKMWKRDKKKMSCITEEEWKAEGVLDKEGEEA